jgi:hypothetical protein
MNALAIQFETLKNSSPFIQVTDNEIIAKYKSDVLNEEGITAAYRMFLDQM